ncbi:hypothetical protein PUN4_340095 [Paraburkholderia unamae]|nr:hypothetical protein PUN4_340095 [Paraburkholderia unamae]
MIALASNIFWVLFYTFFVEKTWGFPL